MPASVQNHPRRAELMGYLWQYLRAKDFPLDLARQKPRARLALEVIGPIWRLNEIYAVHDQQQEFQEVLLAVLGVGGAK